MRHILSLRNLSPREALQISAWISLCLGAGVAAGAEPPQAARYAIEQPSQGLAEALVAIGRQTNTAVLYDPGTVAGRVAKPVSGRMSPIDAISAALRGTGLTAEMMPNGTVVVKPAAPPAAERPATPGRSPSGVPTGTRIEPSGVATMGIAEAEAAASSAEPRDEARHEELTRVEITGSRLRRLDAEGPAPVNVYTRDDIAKSGQPSLQRFLASLSEVSASAGEGTFSSMLGHGTVQLRGMPQGGTLVLINGRKVQGVGSSTGAVFNLNLIPAAAIERVEVLPLGSSAVYGGDALAGVVNVILKKSINGQSFSASAGKGRGIDDNSVSVAVGRQDDDGQFLVIAGRSHSSPLTMREREFFRNVDFRPLGSIDSRREYCTPGTVRSVSGNLPGLNSNVAGIPASASGQALSISDFQATAGSPTLCNQYFTGVGMPLVYGYETASLHVLGERKLFGDWTAFTELTHVRDRMQGAERGSVLYDATVPASNPFNPFGVAVTVSTVLGPENGLQGISRQTNFTRALLGVKGELGARWDAEVTVSTASDRGGSQTWLGSINATAMAAALASSNPATALNPFTTGRAASNGVLRQIWSDALRRSVGRKDQVTALARGAVLDLPAGPVETVVGAEAAEDHFDVVTNLNETHGKRRSYAAYAEARAPLLRSANEAGGRWDLAALTVAARRDHYSDFGSANTYQGGLELRPARSVLVRASVATSFKPPTLTQTNTTSTSSNAAGLDLTDPARGGALLTSGTIIRGTNPWLKPEHGQSRSIGAVWEIEGGLGTRVGITHWQMRIRDMIGFLTPQAVLNAEALFPELVTRAPSVNGQPGIVTSVRSTEVNFGRLDTSGTDVDLAYVWKTAVGKVTASGRATRTSRYDVQLAPGAAVVDRLGRRFSDYWSPPWKGQVGVGIDHGTWNLGVTSRYLGRYVDSGASDRRLGNFWLHDLSGTLDLKKLWPGLLPGFKNASVGVSVANLADRQPQYAQGAPYYDLTQADWRGRYTTVRLTLDW
ncbi:TonB-dependent receptor domain-containing protein [Roseateles sp. DC23W]|uniref:TonB-dependent receptor domain-containing protein n=1 Tax=Pelomonas dachongensis TaxID=3299029 RepID=A0ABW7EYG8_9BURK